jgi:thioesterase domain-containing protein
VRDELGIELPVRDVFEHPTVETLTQFLSYKSERSQYNPILSLRSCAKKPPLFCIVPSGATAVLYTDLARYLRRDCSIFTLIPRGMEFGEQPFNSLQEEITIYLDEIIKIHPEGEIDIIGFSTAGNIAHEIACVLEDRGRSIRFVGLLDSPFVTSKFIEEEISKRDLLLITARVAGLQLEGIADYSEMARIFWKHLLQQKIPLHVKTLDLMDRLLERAVLDTKMIKQLKPRRGGFDITYFIADAEEVTSEINARRIGWRHYCRSINYISVQTRHILMLLPEPSKVIAAAIDDIFETIDT